MQILRCILATIVSLLVWPIVALSFGYLLALIVQPREGQFFLGVWLDWLAIPGLVIGLAAGIFVFQRLTKRPKTRGRASDTRGA